MRKITFTVNPEDFVLRHIFECGQCFRWDEDEDGSYVGIAGGRVARISLDVSDRETDSYKKNGAKKTEAIVRKENCQNATLIIEQMNRCPENDSEPDSDSSSDKAFWYRYFDLDTDYGEIKKILSRDETIGQAIPFGHGIRILRQDPWETTVSFIISQNNNIPRIKNNIRDLSKLAGKRADISSDAANASGNGFTDREWYELPTPEVLAKMTVEDLAPVRLGYRARYLIETAQCVCERGLSVLYDDLDSLCGVGPKVASCIRLFGLNQISSFPIDVWVRRVMKELYGIDKPSEMAAFAEKTFGEYGGIAQQYLFYYMRENN
jgi:N-glycosylase/DNA lyase